MTSERYIIPERVANWTSSMKGPTGRHLCKWCRKEVQKPRLYWCSEACVEEMTSRSGSPRYLAWKRDKGVCAACGIDCDKIERVIQYLNRRGFGETRQWDVKLDREKTRNPQPSWAESFSEKYHWAIQFSWGSRRPMTPNHVWEADHKLPVVEGGGGCGMDNIRTLCIPCHRGETRKLHKRLADKRAGRQTLPGLE